MGQQHHFSIYVTTEEYKMVKIEAVRKNTSIRNLIREMIWAWFKWIKGLEKSKAITAGNISEAESLDIQIEEATKMLEQIRSEGRNVR